MQEGSMNVLRASVAPLELQRDAMARALAKSSLRGDAKQQLAEMYAPAALDQLKRDYADGRLEIEDFEERVDCALRGDIWWRP